LRSAVARSPESYRGCAGICLSLRDPRLVPGRGGGPCACRAYALRRGDRLHRASQHRSHAAEIVAAAAWAARSPRDAEGRTRGAGLVGCQTRGDRVARPVVAARLGYREFGGTGITIVCRTRVVRPEPEQPSTTQLFGVRDAAALTTVSAPNGAVRLGVLSRIVAHRVAAPEAVEGTRGRVTGPSSTATTLDSVAAY